MGDVLKTTNGTYQHSALSQSGQPSGTSYLCTEIDKINLCVHVEQSLPSPGLMVSRSTPMLSASLALHSTGSSHSSWSHARNCTALFDPHIFFDQCMLNHTQFHVFSQASHCNTKKSYTSFTECFYHHNHYNYFNLYVLFKFFTSLDSQKLHVKDKRSIRRNSEHQLRIHTSHTGS